MCHRLILCWLSKLFSAQPSVGPSIPTSSTAVTAIYSSRATSQYADGRCCNALNRQDTRESADCGARRPEEAMPVPNKFGWFSVGPESGDQKNHQSGFFIVSVPVNCSGGFPRVTRRKLCLWRTESFVRSSMHLRVPTAVPINEGLIPTSTWRQEGSPAKTKADYDFLTSTESPLHSELRAKLFPVQSIESIVDCWLALGAGEGIISNRRDGGYDHHSQ